MIPRGSSEPVSAPAHSSICSTKSSYNSTIAEEDLL
jgi:hypothetical protein